MARKTFKKGGSKNTFVMLRHDMIDSPAYRSLSLKARAVYIEVLKRYNGFNNGGVALSCREAGEFCGIGKVSASKAFDELVTKGFLKVGEDAAFNMKTRKSRRWILTHELLGRQSPTNEWRAHK